MHFDREEFAQVARVLLVINDHAQYRFTEETLVDYMLGMAYSTIQDEKATFCGTLGFYLTGFRDYNKEINVRATLAPWLVEKYLNRQLTAA